MYITFNLSFKVIILYIHFVMKNLSKVTILLLAVLTMSACVSKKKYDEAMAAAAAEKSALESALAEANAANEQLKADAEKLEDNLQMSREEIAELSETVKSNNAKIAKLEGAIREAFDTYDQDDVSVGERHGKLYISLANSVLFESGRSRITNEAKEVIAKLAGVIKENGDLSISIEGHTDDEPVRIHKAQYTDNWGLSAARALAILREMEANGVSPERMTAAGKGDTQPIASNDTEEGREQNRRTEFIVNPEISGLYQIYKEDISASSGMGGGNK